MKRTRRRGQPAPADYARRQAWPDGMRVGISGSVGQMFRALFGGGQLGGTLLLTSGDTLLQCMNSVGARELEPVCERREASCWRQFTYLRTLPATALLPESGGFGRRDLHRWSWQTALQNIEKWKRRRPTCGWNGK